MTNAKSHVEEVIEMLGNSDRVNELARHLIAQPNITTAGGGITNANMNTNRVIDLTKLMGECRDALQSIVAPAKPEPVELSPAVPIRKSVHNDYIVCLEDGKKFKSLKRHLRTHYNLTPEQYREKWGLPADYPMVAPSYSATRSKLAKDNGLGTKPGK